jgi:hypothetical protein
VQPDATANPALPTPDEATLARQEAATRRERPATDTFPRAVGVYLQAPSVRSILALLTLALTGRLITPGGSLHELWAVLAVAAGWPLLEWSAHRWVLHLRPTRIGPWVVDPYFARRHRQHHLNPSHFPDVFLPVPVVVGAFAFLGLAGALAGVPLAVVWTFLAAMATASLLYEWVHFVAHCDFRPRSAWLRQVVHRHRLHHYRSEQRWYAFTLPGVDDVFGTGGDGRSVPRSPTIRHVGTPKP